VGIAHRRQADRTVLAGVLFVPDPDQRPLEQLDDCRKHLLARKARLGKIGLRPRTDLGERRRKRDEPPVLHVVANDAPAAVIAVLLAVASITPGRLEVAVGIGTDPDSGPGRRNRERVDPL
jgi:hypothetical protein